VLVGVVAFALARSTLLPGLALWDTGEFQAVAPVLGTAHPTGYPSYILLGWVASLLLAPFGEPALRMNLLSAITLGAAAGLTVVLVRGLTGRTLVAVAAGLLLALTPIPWRIGSFADPHMLHLALVAALLVLLAGWESRTRAGRADADRWLVAAAATYGVALGNQGLTVLLAPGIGLFVLAVEPRVWRRSAQLGRCVAALLGVAVVLYLELPIRAAMGAPLVYGHPDTWGGFWYVVLGQQFGGAVGGPFSDLSGKAGALVSLATAQLGPLAALIPASFLVVVIRRPRYALLTGTSLVVTCWFAASYTNADIERYYLGPILITISWLAIAAAALVDGVEAQLLVIEDDPGPRPPLVRILASFTAAVILVAPAVLAAPTTRLIVDQSADTRAADWSRWAFRTAEPDAILVTWWGYSTPLWYRQVVLGERSDVRVVDDRTRLDENLGSVDDVIRANVGSRPVYLVRRDEDLAALEGGWLLDVVPDPGGLQPLLRVVGPRAARGGPGTIAP
jgi:4-amino-4-deoxy-L-arabinose transferase-like glycosyltransferase